MERVSSRLVVLLAVAVAGAALLYKFARVNVAGVRGIVGAARRVGPFVFGLGRAWQLGLSSIPDPSGDALALRLGWLSLVWLK